MAASLKYFDPITRYAEFFVDGENDLVVLPTTTKAGTGDFSTMKDGVMLGSIAWVTDSASIYYRLRGDESWCKITVSGGGGSIPAGSNAIVFDDNGNVISTTGDVGMATDEDVNNMFP